MALVLLVLSFLPYAMGTDDPTYIERAIARVRREREELQGYMNHNATQQGNWTLPARPDDERLHAWMRSKDALHKEPHAFFANVSGFYAGPLTTEEAHHVDAAQQRERGALVWVVPVSPLHVEVSLVQVPVQESRVARLFGELTVHAHDTSGARAVTQVDLVGVYVRDTGEIYVVGMPQTSPQPLDIRNVLGMLPKYSVYRNDTYKACLADLDHRLQRLQQMQEQGASAPPPPTWSQSENNCSMQLYAQLQPSGSLADQARLDLQERELSAPTGLVLPRAPRLSLDWAGTSNTCGLYLSSQAMTGIARAQFWNDARYYVLGMLVVLLMQLLLMSKECERTQTHSDIARLSATSLFLQTMWDSFLSVAHLVLGFSMPGWLGHAMVRWSTYPACDRLYGGCALDGV